MDKPDIAHTLIKLHSLHVTKDVMRMKMTSSTCKELMCGHSSATKESPPAGTAVSASKTGCKMKGVGVLLLIVQKTEGCGSSTTDCAEDSQVTSEPGKPEAKATS